MTKDFANNQIEVGDVIFFKSGGRYPVESIGVVESFTKSGNPRCYILKWSRNYGSYSRSAKEDKPVAIMSTFVKIVVSDEGIKHAVEELMT